MAEDAGEFFADVIDLSTDKMQLASSALVFSSFGIACMLPICRCRCGDRCGCASHCLLA